VILWCGSVHAKGETCTQCGHAAAHKVGEEIFADDPNPVRHEFTSYLCCTCFSRVMGLRNERACAGAQQAARVFEVLAMLRVQEILEKVHPDKAAQIEWLTSPHAELGGRRPLEAMAEGKAGVVRDMLEGALQGLPS